MFNAQFLSNKLVILGLVVFTTGCTSIAPNYQPDINTANEMKDHELSRMQTGKFRVSNNELNKLSIRATTLVSPYNNSYSEYLKNAIIEQLRLADLLDQKSKNCYYRRAS